jgi:glycosyltransferase involved in cell wall biosynthesis
MSDEILLTISIPTYNRAAYLDICLAQICKQWKGKESSLEVVVSDNCSPDSTGDVVRKYIHQGFPIRYVRNEANIGADRNILQAFQLARGKYAVAFGDDDVFLDGSLDKILQFLQQGEYGDVFLRPYGFVQDYLREKPRHNPRRIRTYDRVEDFLGDISFWTTFISGNIVNKSLLKQRDDLDLFLDTNLIQLSWIFPALLAGKRNAVIDEPLLAMKTENTGGYQLVKVFGENMNKIMKVFSGDGLSQKSIDVMNRNLLLTFFPSFIVKIRSNSGDFGKGDSFDALYPVFKDYALYWVFLVPLIRLPLPLAKGWLFFIRVINKLKKVVQG